VVAGSVRLESADARSAHLQYRRHMTRKPGAGALVSTGEPERAMTPERPHPGSGSAHVPVPVFFLSDSTGISAETMGNALLIQFPDLVFERKLIPFISTAEEARKVVAILDAAMDGPVTPLAFTTAATDEIREVLHTSRCPIIDFFEMHMQRVESILGVPGARVAARLHGVGDIKRYNSRMQAIEYAIEHDDGQSLRALDQAEVILVAPSRCGKTPTTMYLALQHGIFVANYPLIEDDLETTELPRPIRHLQDRCFGLVATPARLSEVRQQRRPNSKYASLEQCTRELRRADALYRANGIPVINSTSRSVEEMSTLILQMRNSRTATERSRR
jgi:regulator of PEP synthase PpsR (kinase-PPPase family)